MNKIHRKFHITILIKFIHMKTIFTLIMLIGFITFSIAQEDSTKTVENKDTTRIEKKDTTRIVLGNKEIKIIESEDGTDIKVRDKDKDEVSSDTTKGREEKWKFRKKHRSGGFRGHLDGFEIGYNGFLNKDMEMSLYGDDRFMSLNNNPTKSFNLGVNFLQQSFGIIGNQAGFVTGLRFQFSNYRFDNNNSIIKNQDDVIVAQYYPDSANQLSLDKSKLTCIYFSIPLCFELQVPNALKFKKRLWISAGIIASLKLDSHTKVVYRDNGRKQKDKNHDDFNIGVLQYSFTGKAGYGNFYAYANYSPVQFFEKNKGPELYPFSVGVGFHFD